MSYENSILGSSSAAGNKSMDKKYRDQSFDMIKSSNNTNNHNAMSSGSNTNKSKKVTSNNR